MERYEPLTVQCPACQAPAGSCCRHSITGEPRGPHRRREEAVFESLRQQLEGAVALLEQAVAELDGWRDKGSEVMRDELVDDFLAAAKAYLSQDRAGV